MDKDKLGHAQVGLLIGFLSVVISPTNTFLLLCSAAIGKEIYDSFHSETHTADVADALVTIGAGALIIFIIGLV